MRITREPSSKVGHDVTQTRWGLRAQPPERGCRTVAIGAALARSRTRSTWHAFRRRTDRRPHRGTWKEAPLVGEHISLSVNGQPREGDVEPRRMLVQFLREDLELTGTHVGCDTSQCGACTVHVDGKAIKSCTMLAVQADGSTVTTIEGMQAGDGALHPLQEAFWAKHGLQCGFCTPGMIMTAADLLARTPNP